MVKKSFAEWLTKFIIRLPLILAFLVCAAVFIINLYNLYWKPQPVYTSDSEPFVFQPVDTDHVFQKEGGISPNTAGIDELCELPGIGEKTAQKFIEEREANGPFVFPEDVLGVKGIGEKKFEKIKDFLTLP